MPAPRAKSDNCSKEFDKILLNAIDNSFFSLGESVKRSIYYHLEEQFKIKRNQIPNKLDKFQLAIEQIFGSGARFLEILIMKNLYLKTGVTISMEEGVSFVDYVKELQQAYTKKQANSNVPD
jgi:hypothetical protein